MYIGNVIHLFITLVVLPQEPANGGVIRAGFRILREEFKWPWGKKPATTVTMYDGCNLCPWGDCRPLTKPPVKPELDLEADVKRVTDILATFKSMKGFSGITEDYKDDLMEVFIKRSEIQRNAIVAAYKAKTNVEVSKAIADLLPLGAPRYEFLMKALATPLPLFFVKKFSDAMELQKNQQKSERGRISIIEMLISLPSCLVNKIIEGYKSGSRDFFTDLKNSLGTAKMTSVYIYAVENLAKNKWGNNNGMMAWIRALLDANKLKKTVASKYTDEIKNRYSELFTKQSFSHIVKTIKAYEYLKNEEGSFLKDINDNELGTVGEIYKIMTRILTDRPLYFATKMEQIFQKKGMFSEGSEFEFIDLFRGRLDIDLQDIIDTYTKQSGKEFIESFKSFVSTFTFHRDPMFRGAMLQILT